MLNCPLCQSRRIHRSKRKGVLERTVLAMLLVRPCRCDSCDHRFFRSSFANPKLRTEHTQKIPTSIG